MFKYVGTTTRGSAWNKGVSPELHDESLWVSVPTRRVLTNTGRGLRADCSGAQGGACRY